MAKTLKSRIDALFTAIGGPETDRPTMNEIRSQLSTFSVSVEALENGEATLEAEAKITALEAALEQSNAELGNLKAELQTAKAGIKRFEAERKQQKEEDRKQDIPDIQFQILQRLPSEHDNAHRPGIEEIANVNNIPVYEAGIHLDCLVAAERVTYGQNNFGMMEWHRTIEGDKLILAKRLAGEEEERKTHKHADLPDIRHQALVMIGADPEGANEKDIADKVGASLLLTQRNLRHLRKASMATSGDEPQHDYGVGQIWWLMEKGEEYLEERGLL